MDIRVPVSHPHPRCECYTIVDTRHVEIVTGPDERGWVVYRWRGSRILGAGVLGQTEEETP